MGKKQIEFSKKLQEFAKKKGVDIYQHLFKKSTFNHYVSYYINSKYRRSVKLSKWIFDMIDHPEIMKIANTLKYPPSHDITMKRIAKYWRNGAGALTYVGDKEQYGSDEYWATIDEILEWKKDDCDGFMTAIYLTARAAGIPDNRLFCTCANVVGGGHAYVTYVANNGVMYAIDGCYWPSRSVNLTNPYFEESNYYFGTKEWFRFNSSGMYKLKR